MGKHLNKIVSAAVLTTMVTGTGIMNPEILGGNEIVAHAAETASVDEQIADQQIKVTATDTPATGTPGNGAQFKKGNDIEGLTFKCWRNDKTNKDYNVGDKIENADATYSPIYEATVTYVDGNEQGKTVGTPQIVEYGKSAKPETVPEKEGYTGTWDNDGSKITGNVTIKPIYEAKDYTITYVDGNESTKVPVKYDQEVELEAVPSKDGQIGTWYMGEEPAPATLKISGDVTLTANYTDVIITFNGYKDTENKVAVNDIEKIPADPNAAQDGKEFTGWGTVKGANSPLKLEEIKALKENTVLYPQYKSTKATVKFQDKEGKDIAGAVSEFTVNDKDSYEVKVPDAPVVDGQKFIYWQDKAGNTYYPIDIKDGKITVKGGTELKAVYGTPITVLFKDGESAETQTIGNGAKIVLPASKGQKDKLFKNWTSSELVGNMNQGQAVIVKDTDNDKAVTIAANYANPIDVTIQGEDGKTIQTVKVPEGGNYDLSKIKAPDVADEDFIGWELTSAEGTAVLSGSNLTNVQKGATVKAKYGQCVSVTVVDGVTGTKTTSKVIKDSALGKDILVKPREDNAELTFLRWESKYTNIAGKEENITVDEGTMAEHDMTITAVYGFNFTVNSLAGKLLYTTPVEYNKNVTFKTPYNGTLGFVKWQDPSLVHLNKDGLWEIDNLKKATSIVALYGEPVDVTINGNTVIRGKGSDITLPDPADRSKEGLSFKCYRDQDGKEYKASDVISNIQKNVTVNPVYEYTVVIKDTMGNTVDTKKVEEGKSIELNDLAAKNGQEFRGWYIESANKAYDAAKKITTVSGINKDTKIVAQYGDQSTITFIDPVSNTTKTYNVKINGSITENAVDREKDGLHFAGWRDESGNVVPDSAIEVNGEMPKTYTAVYTANITFLIKGNAVTQTVEYGKDIVAPTADVIDGYYSDSGLQFIKWNKEFSKAVKDDTITSESGETVSINFMQADGKTALRVDNPWTALVEDDSKNKDGKYLNDKGQSTEMVTGYMIGRGGKVTLPKAPEVAGKTFIGFKDQTGKMYTGTEIDNVQNALTLTAVYGDTVKVTVKDGNAATDITTGTGAVIKTPKAKPQEGTKFKCFRDAAGKEYAEDADVTVTGNMTLTAVYTADVKFMADNKQIGDTVTVEIGKEAKAPEAPAKEGCNFTGWDNDLKAISKDTVVNAKYELKKFNVKFMADGKEVASDVVEYSKDAKLPTNPIKEGYTFAGWDKETTGIKADTVVNAKFNINKYKVVVNGVEQEVEYGKDVKLPANPTKEGYTFKGWEGQTSGIKADGEVKPIFEKTADAAQTGRLAAMMAIAFGSLFAFFKKTKKSRNK